MLNTNVFTRATEDNDPIGAAIALAKNLGEAEREGAKFVVVCSDFHSAAGIFPTALEAIRAAKDMSEEGPCQYVPVPAFVNG